MQKILSSKQVEGITVPVFIRNGSSIFFKSMKTGLSTAGNWSTLRD